MLQIEEFAQLVIDRLRNEYFTEGNKVEYMEIVKNNSVRLPAIAVYTMDENKSVNVYISHLYDECIREKSITLDKCAEAVYEDFNGSQICKIEDFRTAFLSFDKIKSSLQLVLRNADLNRERLEDCVYKKWLDFAVTAVIAVDLGDGNTGQSLCKKQLLKLWDKSEEEVLQIAEENMWKTNNFVVKVMFQYMQEVLKKEGRSSVELPDVGLPMFVLTNIDNTDGAIAMYNKSILRDAAAGLNSGFYILPSSIHEVILYPADEFDDVEVSGLKNIVHEVNRDVLSKMEILSDNVYYYDKNADDIIMFQSSQYKELY